MPIAKSVHLKAVHVAGTHDEFETAVGDAIKEAGAADLPEGAEPDGLVTLNVTGISHAHAIAPDGEHHWSAFVTVEISWWDSRE
ncbi:MAG TPA: hypothetical protein VEX39_03510 [Thermoleophilaceae bacterium]|nr:hypothetical protein [Thermoleophilaceae bacterium]